MDPEGNKYNTIAEEGYIRTDTNQNYQQTSNLQNEQIRKTGRAVERTFEDTRNNINRVTEEARKEVSKSADQLREYQEDSIKIINNIANNFINSQKELLNSFSDSLTGNINNNNNNRSRNISQMSWLYNNYFSPERLAEMYGENVSSFTNFMIRYGSLVNNLTISNINYFKSFLQQIELYSKEFYHNQQKEERGKR